MLRREREALAYKRLKVEADSDGSTAYSDDSNDETMHCEPLEDSFGDEMRQHVEDGSTVHAHNFEMESDDGNVPRQSDTMRPQPMAIYSDIWRQQPVAVHNKKSRPFLDKASGQDGEANQPANGDTLRQHPPEADSEDTAAQTMLLCEHSNTGWCEATEPSCPQHFPPRESSDVSDQEAMHCFVDDVIGDETSQHHENLRKVHANSSDTDSDEGNKEPPKQGTATIVGDTLRQQGDASRPHRPGDKSNAIQHIDGDVSRQHPPDGDDFCECLTANNTLDGGCEGIPANNVLLLQGRCLAEQKWHGGKDVYDAECRDAHTHGHIIDSYGARELGPPTSSASAADVATATLNEAALGDCLSFSYIFPI